MDHFVFKKPGAQVINTLKIPDIDGESQIDIYPVGGSGGVRLVHVEPRAFDGVDGEAKDFDPGPAAVVSFDDPLLG
ncbi:hypothetical protein M4578_02255 [Salipiger sp. P9]|uniref:hypothetical protein n=1 Tax=Salipiger pentaromativorans TaxID=2943193 RepID=UPI0021586B18|nr:hypothetical protein [Salipiger pentaromativorans]MCR8546636.1 hypothetical protein [Salipiger pentaromativorans]